MLKTELCLAINRNLHLPKLLRTEYSVTINYMCTYLHTIGSVSRYLGIKQRLIYLLGQRSHVHSFNTDHSSGSGFSLESQGVAMQTTSYVLWKIRDR